MKTAFIIFLIIGIFSFYSCETLNEQADRTLAESWRIGYFENGNFHYLFHSISASSGSSIIARNRYSISELLFSEVSGLSFMSSHLPHQHLSNNRLNIIIEYSRGSEREPIQSISTTVSYRNYSNQYLITFPYSDELRDFLLNMPYDRFGSRAANIKVTDTIYNGLIFSFYFPNADVFISRYRELKLL